MSRIQETMRIDRAISVLGGMSPDEVEAWVIGRLAGHDLQPFAHPLETESSADVVVELLRQDRLDEALHRQLIAGSRSFAANVVSRLISVVELDSGLIRDVRSLCAILEIARPTELKDVARTLFACVAGERVVLSELRPDVVRCLFTYGVEKRDMDLWLNLLEDDTAAAYAVRALVELDPTDHRIIEALTALWHHRLYDGWQVQVIPLMCDATESDDDRGSDIGLRIMQALCRRPDWSVIEEQLLDDPEGCQWLERQRRLGTHVLARNLWRQLSNNIGDAYQQIPAVDEPRTELLPGGFIKHILEAYTPQSNWRLRQKVHREFREFKSTLLQNEALSDEPRLRSEQMVNYVRQT